jgi:aminocarboxymuconate-semialdehyde decarboxylase
VVCTSRIGTVWGKCSAVKIDIHNHAIPQTAIDLLQKSPVYRVETDGVRWRGGNHVEFSIVPSFVDPSAKLDELASRGIDFAVIAPAPPLFYYELGAGAGAAMSRAVNTGLEGFCRAAPSRLRWLAHVPMQDPKLAAVVLREARTQGSVGAEVGTSISGRRLDEPEFDPFWEAAESLGMPVLIHPAYNEALAGLRDYYLDNVIGNLLETTVAIERLICSRLLDRYSGLRLVFVHGGGFFPYGVGRLRHAIGVRRELSSAPSDPLAYRDRMFFDTVTHDIEALKFLANVVGTRSLVLGTDLPFDMAMSDPIGSLRAAVGEAEATLIAEENPAALFGLSESKGE